MTTQTPYGRLVGVWKIYLAPATESKTNLDATPSGNWVEVGATDGEQVFQLTGSLTPFMDNDSTGPRKHVRPEEGAMFKATLVNLTLEHRARIRGMATADVTTTTSGALAVKRLPNRRGYVPTRYSLLARGGAIESSNTMSPYGAWPAQLYIPIGVFDGEPEETYAKDGSPGIEFEFLAEWDSTQTAGNEFGYLEVQSS